MTNRPRVLYVDAFSDRNAQSNVRGTANAYRKAAWLYTFDYRESAGRLGPRLPWNRPDIWDEDKWRDSMDSAIDAMNAELLETAVWLKPDFVHLGKCEIVRGHTVARIKENTGAFVVHFYGDLSREVKPWVAEIGKAADITLLYNRDVHLARKHIEAGCRDVGFWWVGTDPDVYQPMPTPKDYDVIFFGRFIHESGAVRVRLIRELAGAGVRVHVFGTGWEELQQNDRITVHPFVDEDGFAWACSRAKVSLSVNANDVPMYASWRRIFNSMACGICTLVRWFPGLETVFKNGEQTVWFKSVDDACTAVERLLKDDRERERIAATGRAEVLRAHTWDHRIDEMLRLWRPEWHRPTS